MPSRAPAISIKSLRCSLVPCFLHLKDIYRLLHVNSCKFQRKKSKIFWNLSRCGEYTTLMHVNSCSWVQGLLLAARNREMPATQACAMPEQITFQVSMNTKLVPCCRKWNLSSTTWATLSSTPQEQGRSTSRTQMHMAVKKYFLIMLSSESSWICMYCYRIYWS